MFGPRKNSIHIKNLPDSINYNDVWLEFKKFGDIVNVTIPVDVNTTKAKGYAFVEYADCDDAAKAISEMNGVLLWGRILTIEYSRSYPKTSREMALRSMLQPLRPNTINAPTNFSSALIPRAVSPHVSGRDNRRWSSRSSSRSHRRGSHRDSSASSCCSSERSRSRPRRRSRKSRGRSGSSRCRSGSSRCRSRSETRSYSARYVRKWTVSPKDGRHKPKRSHSSSEDEIVKFNGNDNYCLEIDPFSDELPDSVVIAANLMRSSSSSSLSVYSASSQSSESPQRSSKRKRRHRPHRPRSRQHRRRRSVSSNHSASHWSTD